MKRHRITWVASVVLGVGLLAVSAAWAAQRGIVKFKDGRPPMEGEIEEKQDTVSVSVPAGERRIQIDIPRDAVASIEYVANLDAEYKARLAKIDKDDPKAHLEIARWAFEHKKWAWAREQVDAARAIEPNSKDAADLADTIRLQERLEAKGPSTPPATSKLPATSDSHTPAGTVEKRFLTPEQINRIRQKEITPSKEKGLILDIRQDLQARFADVMNIDRRKFSAYQPIEQWKLFMEKNDQKFIDEVKVRNDPQSMLQFRTRVMPGVTAGCASTQCHGGPAGKGLILYPATNDESVYTDFYILQKYSRKIDPVQPTIGKGPLLWKMIDRTQPEQSLLLQYALPWDIADADHPQVAGWKPLYGNKSDARYTRVLEWIRDSLEPVEPDYGIDYKPPQATTQPAK